MRRLTSALALAAIVGAPAAHAAVGGHVSYSLSADYQFNGYSFDSNDSTFNDGSGNNSVDGREAMSQLFRIKTDMTNHSGLKFFSSITLEDTVLSGSNRGTEDTQYTEEGQTAGNTAVDYAYMQVMLPMDIAALRIGRQQSNWADCFLTCDSRVDRILLANRVGGVTAGVLYDKRNEQTDPTAPFDGENADDDESALGMIVQLNHGGGINSNLLLYRISFADDAGDANTSSAVAGNSVQIISPYFHYDDILGLGVDLKLGGAYQDMGDLDPVAPPSAPAPLTLDDGEGFYVKVGYDLMGLVKIEAQHMQSDGFQLSNGFDTYSSMIASSPSARQNPMSVYSFAPGSADNANSATFLAESDLTAVRLSGNVSRNIKLVGSAGSGTVGWYNWDFTATGLTGDARTDHANDFDFQELQAHWQVNRDATLWLARGKVDGSYDDGSSYETEVTSLNLRASF